MNDDVYSLLHVAGWYRHRNIDIDYEIEILQREGFSLPNDSIIDLLKEFWNLRIEFTLPDGKHSDIELNIETAIDNFDVDANRVYELQVNEKLIPVGVLHFNTALILVSLGLNFYMIADRKIYKVAESFESFLDVVINRKDIW